MFHAKLHLSNTRTVVKMDRWRGCVAVVTGASAGIGKDIAQKLVEEGLQVAGLARRVELVTENAKHLSGKPGKLIPFKCDITDEDDVANTFKLIKEQLGSIQILINNAGKVVQNSLIDGTPKLWKEVLDTNLYGLSVCTHYAVKQMREANLVGHIININSVVGHKVINSNPNLTNMYSPSKHGVTAITEVLRQELRFLKTNIKITSISPGFVKDTDIFNAGNFDETSKEWIKKLAYLVPEDVTESVIYALSTKPHVQVHELILKPLGEDF